jgi:hypothetical protein
MDLTSKLPSNHAAYAISYNCSDNLQYVLFFTPLFILVALYSHRPKLLVVLAFLGAFLLLLHLDKYISRCIIKECI